MKKLVLLPCILLVFVASSYAQFAFTSIECPGGGATTARGINNHGEIVGSHRGLATLFKAGECISLAPTTVLGTNPSDASRINDGGDVVGYFYGDDGFKHGFLLRKGVLTTLDFPGASQTWAMGINESGTVSGLFDLFDSDGNFLAEHGFIWKDGSFSQVDFPGSTGTAVSGINARGDFVGGWSSDVGPLHGYVFSKGQFISFDVPVAGSTATQPTDINVLGHIIGRYDDADGVTHGFLEVGAAFTSFDFPGDGFTSAWGINTTGQIVGNHSVYPGGPTRGYLAQPIKK